MVDLRQNLTRLAELSAFILGREGSIPHFYCDRNGWVTIGIGALVKTEDDARQMARNNSVHFAPRDIPRRRAGADDVVADWRRVHNRPGLRTQDYLYIAQLRSIPRRSMTCSRRKSPDPPPRFTVRTRSSCRSTLA